MKFRAVVQLGGKTATGIPVPLEVVAALGTSKKPAVSVTIGSYTYRSTVASMGGEFMLPLGAEHRAGAGVSAGDEVEVELQLDTAPREAAVPPGFLQALDGDADARHHFEALAYSHKLRHVLSIEDAKTPERRQRRIAEAMDMLREGRR